jgi:hypothetical protein
VADGVEDTNHNGRVDPASAIPTIGATTGVPDGAEDADKDGVVDGGELDPDPSDVAPLDDGVA